MIGHIKSSALLTILYLSLSLFFIYITLSLASIEDGLYGGMTDWRNSRVYHNILALYQFLVLAVQYNSINQLVQY